MDFWTRFAIHTVIVAIGLGLFLRTLYGRARVLQSVQWTNLFDKIPERIQALLVIGFGQKKFLIDKREKSAGWMHFFIFWGFTILGVRVATAFAQGWFGPEFHLPLLGVDMLGGPYLLLKDIIEVFVLVSISYALVRWLILHPHRLYGFRPAEDRLAGQDHVEAIVILCCIGGIMLTDLCYEAGRYIAYPDVAHVVAERGWTPVASTLASVLPLGAGGATLLSELGWWGHNLLILFMLNLLPL